MIFTETKIPGVLVIELERRRDERGFFARQWCADEFTRAGLGPRVDVMRGVHHASCAPRRRLRHKARA
jgi:dTDP-4-dehydrorhamnose 3,5-epimerase-like enzyme